MPAFAPMLAVIFLLLAIGGALADGRQQLTLPTANGQIAIERVVAPCSQPRPAVLILSGSKGFASSAYDEIGRNLAEAGLDAYLVHILSPADLDAIKSAGSAAARIAYYSKRMPGW